MKTYRSGVNRGLQVGWRNGEAWLYSGRSFELDKRIQRQRASRRCGYAQLALGRVRHYGQEARRTVGLQITTDRRFSRAGG